MIRTFVRIDVARAMLVRRFVVMRCVLKTDVSKQGYAEGRHWGGVVS